MLIIEYGAKVAIIFLTTILLYHFFFYSLLIPLLLQRNHNCVVFAKLIVRDEIECFCIKKSIQTNEVWQHFVPYYELQAFKPCFEQ